MRKPREPRREPLSRTDQALADWRARAAAAGDVRAKTAPLPGSFQARAQLRECTCHHCGTIFQGIHGEIGCRTCTYAGLPQFAGGLWDDEPTPPPGAS